MINSIQLSDYSNKVYGYLKNDNSELIENISFSHLDSGDNHIIIELKSPNQNIDTNLFFSSQRDMLTVGFDMFHCHYDNFSGQDFDKEIKKALECFYKILKEELFVVNAGGGITTLLTSEEINILEAGQKLENFNYDNIKYYSVTSWSGNYDRMFKT